MADKLKVVYLIFRIKIKFKFYKITFLEIMDKMEQY